MADGLETPAPSTPAVPGKGKAGGLAEEIKRIPIWVWFVIAVVFFVVYKTYFANSAVGNTGTSATDNSLASAGDTSTTGDTVGADSGAGISTASTTGPDTTSSSSSSGPKTQPASPPPSGKSGGSKTVYTIQPGDTLSGIGARFNVPWEQVYQANESVIEQTAQQRSGHSSNGGMWIYPGEKLVIP